MFFLMSVARVCHQNATFLMTEAYGSSQEQYNSVALQRICTLKNDTNPNCSRYRVCSILKFFVNACVWFSTILGIFRAESSGLYFKQCFATSFKS